MKSTASFARALLASLIVLSFSACSGTEKPEALLAKAQAALAASDPKTAEIHLKNLLQEDENNAEARFMLADIAYKARDLRSAEKEYRRARELGFDANKLTPPLLDAMYRLGKMKEVTEEGRALALSDAVAQAQALTTVGRAHIRLAQPAEARKAFAAALAAKADFVPAQVGVATLQAIDDRPGARAAVDAILARAPASVEALTLEGDLDLADRRLPQAREIFRKVAELAPDDVDTRVRLVSVSLEMREVDAASQAYEGLKKLAPGAPGTHYLHAMIEAMQNHPEAARSAVQEALRLAPEYMPAVSLAAGLNLTLGSLEQAERYARMLVERTPDNPIGYRVLGATYLRMNQPDRALEAVRPALARNSTDPVILAIAGEASLKLNEPGVAAGYFERASKANPGDSRARTGIALSHLASGDRTRGIAELEQAVELDSSNLQADVALVMAQVREKQFDKALAAVARMEKKAPDNPMPFTLRGAVLSAKGDVKGARAAFEKALQVDPAFYAAAANLAAFDLRDKRPGDARQRYESVLAKDPKNSQAAVALAALTASTGGSREQVLAALKKAREGNPDAVLPILATARYLIETNTPKDAIPMLQEAANRNPDNAQVLDTLATAFLRSEQRGQAISTWEKALRLNPRDAAAQFRIGDAQLADGNRDAALQSFRKAAEMAPDTVEPKVGMALVLEQQGKKDEALGIATRMQAAPKLKLAGTVLEGDLLASDGKFAQASERYRAAFAQQHSLQIGVKAHRALRAAKRQAEADTFLRDWVRAEPANLPLRLYAGESETLRKRWKEAFDQYAVVLEKEPNNALALNNSAWALHELKDSRALDYARRAYEAVPKSASIADTYGVILSEAGDRKGVEMLRQAVELAPGNAQMHLHLAEALARAGDKAAAKTHVDEVLKISPSGELADAARSLQGKLQ